MKKILTILALGIFASCTKPETAPKIIAPSACDTGGIVGNYVKYKQTGAEYLRFEYARFDSLGTDSFKVQFYNAQGDSSEGLPSWKSPAMPCSKMEYRNSFFNIPTAVMYVYINDEGYLVDSLVNEGVSIGVLYYYKTK